MGWGGGLEHDLRILGVVLAGMLREEQQRLKLNAAALRVDVARLDGYVCRQSGCGGSWGE